MYPSTFEIRCRTTNKCVDLEELDKKICDFFALKYSANDYGHFLFSEGEMHQSSISWVGFIHTIVYYSDIDYGVRRKSEVLGALAFVIEYAVKFPFRMMHILSQLLDLLYDELNMCIYVTVYPDEYDQLTLKNNYTHELLLKNETGAFLCDEGGKLLSYYPSIKALMDKTIVKEYYSYGASFYKPCIYVMKVPEGVTGFSRDFFRGGMINGELELPNSLKTIGTEMDDCVFADTYIGHITIPMSVESIGTYAFGNSKIVELFYPYRIIESQYLRQFKGASIDNLIISKDVSNYLHKNELRDEHLFYPYEAEIMNCIVH